MKKQDKLFDIIDRFSDYSVLILGDIILDEYICGNASRLSPEAPVPVLEAEDYKYILGGAANVASNIKSLGGNAYILGVVGDDHQANILISELRQNNVLSSYIVKDKSRPTTTKTRLLAHSRQQIARIDKESTKSIPAEIENELLQIVEELINGVDIVVLSDYAKGVLTPFLIEQTIKICHKHGKKVLIDPKGIDYIKYNNADIITPNRLEAELASQSPKGTCPEQMAKNLQRITDIDTILVTLGENGVLIYKDDQIEQIPAISSQVYDVTGAGDSLISTLALSLAASGFELADSIWIGNYAAGVAVRKIGTTTIKPDEIKEIIKQHFSQAEQKEEVCCI